MTIGTYGLGRVAGNDTKAAVRNVSLLYLGELAGREGRTELLKEETEAFIKEYRSLGERLKEILS